jgi:hypothetical protein
MTDSRAAVGFDRLPWLDDEPERARRRGSPREVAGWIVAAVLLVAGASYWLGQRSASEPEPPAVTRPATPSTTVPLPAPQGAEPQVQPSVLPEVEPAPVRTVTVSRPKAQRPVTRRLSSASGEQKPSELSEVQKAQETAPAAPAPAPKIAQPVAEKPLKLWPARISQGASGRLVQIGAFGSRQQAKLGWRHMMRAYPAVGRLPATVVSARNSRGRYFYRFQIGTTSQAHSEVLCQRMEQIRFSCAVIGLPWKPKGVER